MNSTILKISLPAYNDDSFCKTKLNGNIPSCLEGHFLGIRRGVELRRGDFFITFTFLFYFVAFFTYLMFLFLFERFYVYAYDHSPAMQASRCLHYQWPSSMQGDTEHSSNDIQGGPKHRLMTTILNRSKKSSSLEDSAVNLQLNGY